MHRFVGKLDSEQRQDICRIQVEGVILVWMPDVDVRLRIATVDVERSELAISGEELVLDQLAVDGIGAVQRSLPHGLECRRAPEQVAFAAVLPTVIQLSVQLADALKSSGE
jgi:hypothetical protein